MIESPDGSLGPSFLVVHTSSSGIILCHWPNFVGLRHPHAQPYLWENDVGLGLGALAPSPRRRRHLADSVAGLGAEHEVSPTTSWAA